MAKIVTSEGIQDFVATGKPTEVIESDQAKAAAARKAALNAKLAATDAPVIEAPKAAAPPPDEEKATPKAEEVKKEPEKTEPEHELDEDEKKFAKDIQKKIFKQIAKRKEAQAEAQTAREEAAEAERFAKQLFDERELWKQKAEEAERRAATTPKAEEAAPTLVKPDPQDKKYYDETNKFKVWEYSDDVAAYSAKKAVEDDRKAQAAQAAERERQAAEAAFKARIAKATEKYPDWEKVVGGSELTLQNECLQYIAQSDNGTELAYYLAKNKDVAERIRGLHPIRAIAELGKLETGLEKSAAPPASAAPPKEAEPVRSAPAPITPISTSGTGTVNLDPAKMNFKELRAYERERAKNRR